MSLIAPGEVWLVGAGPGDPDLLTRKAAALLGAADVVFHDALVGAGILALIPPQVRQVSVGKRSGAHAKSQSVINRMVAEAAQAGDRVVRLKGGDPTVFGRAAEEIAHLAAHNIPVRVCPGVTTACAAAASAGVSLTTRQIAREVIFVTAQACAGHALDLDWNRLADPRASLVVYMGRDAAAGIAQALMGAGRDAATPVLVALDVSLPTERIVRARLATLAVTMLALPRDVPTTLMIGESFLPTKALREDATLLSA